MSNLVNSGRYVTAKRAKALRQLGLAVQVGQYIEDMNGENRRLMHRDDANDKMGICLNPTNKELTVGQRSYLLFMSKGKININEPVSAHLAKKVMTETKLRSEIDRLGHLANKIDASRSILKEELEADQI